MSLNSYTLEENVCILIALLKANNIKKIIVSPGSTNASFVLSLQNDDFFQLYSCIDERSAAYMACGLAEETGEVVVISCTGAPAASRNYLPGLTEAYYRKLPILAITSTQRITKLNKLIPQITDRSVEPRDSVKSLFFVPVIKHDDDRKHCENIINRAIIDLFKNGTGPVLLNVEIEYTTNFEQKKLPNINPVKFYTVYDSLPKIQNLKTAIFVGSHRKMDYELVHLIEAFCEQFNACIFADHTSGYNGKYKIQYSLLAGQIDKNSELMAFDLLIHFGEISGDYYTQMLKPTEVWRISEDGVLHDTFSSNNSVFCMNEKYFFKYYFKNESVNLSLYENLKSTIEDLRLKIPDVPFSNIWIASYLSKKLPQKSTIYFSILNTLRSWNFFEIDNTINTFSNVGAFGIDGGLSSLIGASLADRNKLFFAFTGDLAFFYDMNSLGNREISNNLRIMIINNGLGTEFKHYNSWGGKYDTDIDQFIAAKGHFNNKDIIKQYTQALGFKYISAIDKKEFLENYLDFIIIESEKPVVFEVFTSDKDESESLEKVLSINKTISGEIKKTVKKTLGESNTRKIQQLFKHK